MRLNLHSLQVDVRGIELMLQHVSKRITQLLGTLHRYQVKLDPSRHDDSAEDEIDSSP